MIFVTGDIHGDVYRFSKGGFVEQDAMDKEEYLIICGDFGGVWNWQGESRDEKHKMDWLDSRSFTTLFVDGNHENFDRLNAYPVEKWRGGLVHKIRPSVIHLMRGQMYNVNGMKIFAFGGASSHDIRDGILDPIKDEQKIRKWARDYEKLFRVRNRDWWEAELPTQEEMDTGIVTLNGNDWKCDYVITHSPDTNILAKMGLGLYKPDYLSDYLYEIRQKLDYKKWFFGHMHVNQNFAPEKAMCLYEQIIRIA